MTASGQREAQERQESQSGSRGCRDVESFRTAVGGSEAEGGCRERPAGENVGETINQSIPGKYFQWPAHLIERRPLAISFEKKKKKTKE